MGNRHSLRRVSRNEQHRPRIQDNSHLPGSSSADALSAYRLQQNYSESGYVRGDGQYVVDIQPPTLTQIMNPPPPVRVSPLAAFEHLKANTIKNDVHLKKSSLKLEEDVENPGFYLVSFSFDAISAGWICIFFLCKEGDQCSLNSIKPELYAPVCVPFEKGLGQKFKQAPGTGVNLSLFEESELREEGLGDVFPLVVRTETIPKSANVQEHARDKTPLNAPLSEWVHAQMTHAVLEKKDGEFLVRVVKQIIYIDGIRYELQEIYGIENADGYGDGTNGNDSGKECVVCLSEPRDTTVLPCRHMCMCSGCAKVLRFQSSRCPICRTPVERLFEIKVSNRRGSDASTEGNSRT